MQALRDHCLERVEIHSLNNSEGMAPSSTDQMGQIRKRTAESRFLDRTIYSAIVNLPHKTNVLFATAGGSGVKAWRMLREKSDQMGQIRKADSGVATSRPHDLLGHRKSTAQNERALCYGGWQWCGACCESMAHAVREGWGCRHATPTAAFYAHRSNLLS